MTYQRRNQRLRFGEFKKWPGVEFRSFKMLGLGIIEVSALRYPYGEQVTPIASAIPIGSCCVRDASN